MNRWRSSRGLPTGSLRWTRGVKVTYLPVAPPQAEAALSEGMGDFVANAFAVTPDREKRFAFSVPIQTNVTRIVVSGPGFGPFCTLDELAGKEIYVNPLTIAYQELQKLNDSLQKAGKTPIHVREADKNLTDDDLVQMVNAGLIPATITTRERAELWSKVFDNLKGIPRCRSSPRDIRACYAEEQSPAQTASGRIRRQPWSWYVFRKHDLASLPEEYQVGEKFHFRQRDGKVPRHHRALSEICRAIRLRLPDAGRARLPGIELNQNKRSPVGAVGIMQVIPRFAAAAPINIANVG